MSDLDERSIKRAVVEQYGARARSVLSAAETSVSATSAPAAQALTFVNLADAPGDGAACGVDGDCCGPVGALDIEHFTSLYQGANAEGLPTEALAAAAGCGNPVALAELEPGERVLDLGAGGGIDCFFAAQQVGEDGEVWGLDMTPDMVALARRNADQIGATNVRFRLGEIEDLPFPDETFDVVISNCVINLSPDKAQVFREAFRVLRPGGRLRVSDMVLTRELPPEVASDVAQWAGCVAGALPVDQYLALVRAAGFETPYAEYEESERGIASAYLSAVRPG